MLTATAIRWLSPGTLRPHRTSGVFTSCRSPAQPPGDLLPAASRSVSLIFLVENVYNFRNYTPQISLKLQQLTTGHIDLVYCHPVECIVVFSISRESRAPSHPSTTTGASTWPTTYTAHAWGLREATAPSATPPQTPTASKSVGWTRPQVWTPTRTWETDVRRITSRSLGAAPQWAMSITSTGSVGTSSTLTPLRPPSWRCSPTWCPTGSASFLMGQNWTIQQHQASSILKVLIFTILRRLVKNRK